VKSARINISTGTQHNVVCQEGVPKELDQVLAAGHVFDKSISETGGSKSKLELGPINDFIIPESAFFTIEVLLWRKNL